MRVLLLPAVFISAQFNIQPAMAQIDPLRMCQEIADPQERLACFDNQMANAVKQEEEEKRRQVNAIEEARKTAKENFGLSRSAAQDAVKERIAEENDNALQIIDASQEPGAINSSIAEASRDGNRKWFITLENVQIWQESAASGFKGLPRAGAKVEIKKKGLGWYRMYIKGKKVPLAVRRVK